VTPAEAAELFKLLRAAYPEAKRRVGEDTTHVWLAVLRQFDSALGEQAVRSLIGTARRWPSLAELHEQVEIARRQAAEARCDRERQEADELAEELPRPPLEDIPAVRELLDRWAESFGLPPAGPGECEQCGKEATQRWTLGTFTLCRECVRSRKAAALVAQGQRPAGQASAFGPARRRDPEPRASTRSRGGGRPPSESRETCRLCDKRLRPHEAPEGECDDCLRGRGGGPTFPADHATEEAAR
jgi:hypothetical protein